MTSPKGINHHRIEFHESMAAGSCVLSEPPGFSPGDAQDVNRSAGAFASPANGASLDWFVPDGVASKFPCALAVFRRHDKSRPMRRLVIGALIALVVTYAGVCAAMWHKQGDFIFYPSRTVRTTPAEFGAPFERVVLPLDDDRLAGWWIPAKEPGTRTLLYVHGNAGNIGPNAEHAVRLQNAGLNVLV